MNLVIVNPAIPENKSTSHFAPESVAILENPASKVNPTFDKVSHETN